MTKVFVLVSTLAIFVGQGCGDSEGAGNNGNQGGTGGVGGTAGGGGNGAGTPQGGTGPGTHIWSRRLDVTENYEGPSVAVDSAGNAIVSSDGLFAKLDSAGEVLWTKLFGGSAAVSGGDFLLAGELSCGGDRLAR